MKILFQGDSITDAGRIREDYHNLGDGYPKYAAALIKANHPKIDFEFINLGISGDKTENLVERLQSDFIDINPDIVTILIGVNDVWHHSYEKDWIPMEVFEQRYRTVLTEIKEKTHAKILMMEPFLLPSVDKEFFREDLNPKIDVVRKLAREFADVYLPTDGLLYANLIGKEPFAFSSDGVHPNDDGRILIGKLLASYIEPLIKD